MKVICTQENLRNGLLTVGRIISPSNTLPILNNMLLETENGLLKISSTNLEVAISTHIRCKVEQEGRATIFSKTIIDLVGNLPNKNITLEAKGNEILIETENHHSSLKTLPADEFPLIPEPEGQKKFTIAGQDLKNSLNQVIFAASTNQTQPEISGISMEIEEKNIIFAATDRYRLAEKKQNLDSDTNIHEQVIIPQKTAMEISRIIGNLSELVEILLSENQITFTIGPTKVISRLVDGQYPPYKAIIPENFTTTIRTAKTSLVNALKAGGIFSQANNSVKFGFNQEQQLLMVVSESQDLGKSLVDIPSEIEGQSGELVLNHKYVLDSLGSIESPTVVIKIINDSSPTLFVPEGQNNYLYLVMPIKI